MSLVAASVGAGGGARTRHTHDMGVLGRARPRWRAHATDPTRADRPDTTRHQMTITTRDVPIGSDDTTLVTMVDRRPGAGSMPIEWMFLADLEQILYDHAIGESTGAIYHLLKRSGVGTRCLALRRGSIADGIVSKEDFEALKTMCHNGVRRFSLVPIDAVCSAIETFGPSPTSIALLRALAMPRPASWSDDEEEREGEAESEEGGEQDGADDADDAGGGGSGNADGNADGSDGVCDDPAGDGGGTTGDGGGGTGGGGASGQADDAISTTDSGAGDIDTDPLEPKRQRPSVYKPNPSSALAADIVAFVHWRVAPLQPSRRGPAVVAGTAAGDVRAIYRFFGWLAGLGKLPSEPRLSIFIAAQVPVAIQRYVEELRECGRLLTYAANILGSFVVASRYASSRAPYVARSQALEVETKIHSLHGQSIAGARVESMFSQPTPAAWLGWREVNSARRVAEDRVATYTGGDAVQLLHLTRDAALLVLFTHAPPDRVGVVRLTARHAPRTGPCHATRPRVCLPSTRRDFCGSAARCSALLAADSS